MALIADLLERLPVVKDVNMTSSGLALWICWEGDLDAAVPQTLQDYGGMSVAHDRNQSLWYFFTTDVFLAVARLAVWAQFNPLSVNIEVLPARLLLGVRREISVALEAGLTKQEVMVPQSLMVWVHPKAREGLGNMPGLTFTSSSHIQGMTPLRWDLLEADPRLPYTSSQGWYALLKPLGNPLDKRFQTNWRAMFSGIDQIIQRHKMKYNSHDYFIMLPLDNLRQLRAWTRELLQYIAGTKGQPEIYWPCVSVCIEKKGLNFNNELPNKVGIKWDNLMPDFPYMSYRNAFLLGEGFGITDLHYSSANSTMDNWCTVALGEDQLAVGGYIPVLVAGQTMTGDGGGCFYCGMRSHTANNCPSRKLKFSDTDIWADSANLDIDTINESFREMDATMHDNGVQGLHSLLDDSRRVGQLVRTVFEVSLPNQLRAMERMWQTVGRDFPTPVDESIETTDKRLAARDDSPAWALLERFIKLQGQDLISFERDVVAAISRIPRDVRLRTLLGFVLMERGDFPRAQNAWKEAEALSGSGLHQAWHLFLLARLLEVTARLSEAQDMYQEVLRVYPQWREAEYRLIVCRVKMGFAEQVQPFIQQLLDQDPPSFNRFLIDHELERGQLIILTALFPKWNDTKRMADEERTHLDRLDAEVQDWFPEDHGAAMKFRARLSDLKKRAETSNYLSFLQAIRNRPQLEKDIKVQIQQEIERVKERFKEYLGILEVVRDEAAWFPFPRILVEFNRDFNECASILNWAFSSNFHEPEAFKRAQAYVPNIVELLTRLENRLRFLRVVRDTTLYVLILGRTFFWVEVASLILCIIVVPTIAVFGHEFGMGWLRAIIRTNHWELQKVLLLVVSAMALGVAALRTTIVFERKRDELVADARARRQEMQRQRLDRVKAMARTGKVKTAKPPPTPPPPPLPSEKNKG